MQIDAKLRCETVERAIGPVETVRFTAVDGSMRENEGWSKWTPDGQLKLTITNPAAHGVFTPGKEYMINITPVEATP